MRAGGPVDSSSGIVISESSIVTESSIASTVFLHSSLESYIAEIFDRRTATGSQDEEC